MRIRILAITCFCVTFGAAEGVSQTTNGEDVKLRLIGRVQAQFSTTSVDEDELLAAGRAPAAAIPASMFETRRVRLGAEIEYQEWLTGKIETEVAMARLQLRDAYVNMAFDPRIEFRVGQFKKPFSLLQLYTETMWPVIERGVRIRGLGESLALRDSLAGGDRVMQSFRGTTVVGEEQELLEVFGYQNYDLGAALHGELGAFSYSAGVFNGTGSDRPDDSDAKSYAARLAYQLPVSFPITIGTALSYHEYRITSRPAIETGDGTAYEADIEIGAFRRPGPHLLGEIAIGDNLQDESETFWGAQGMLTWFQPLRAGRIEGIELGGRVSYGDPRRDIADDEGLLLTPGINLYFSGRNRLMLNWDFFQVSDRFKDEHSLRAQAQFYF